MQTRVLVPLEMSATAEEVLPYVQMLARRLQVLVELLRAVEHQPHEWMDWDIGMQPLQFAAHTGRQAREYGAVVASSLVVQSLAVSR